MALAQADNRGPFWSLHAYQVSSAKWLTCVKLGRPSDRARGGHERNVQIRSLLSDADDMGADLLDPDPALRAVEPPDDHRLRLRVWIPRGVFTAPEADAVPWRISIVDMG